VIARSKEDDLRWHAAVATAILATAPLTLDASRWYAGRGLLVVAAILSFTVWAFWTSRVGGSRWDS
jgi:hypothetical protein